MHLRHVEPPVTDEFSRAVEHGYLVAEPRARLWIGIDVDEFDRTPLRRRQPG